MFLNDAEITLPVTINGVTYNSKMKLLKALVETNNLFADIIINTKIISAGIVSFNYNSGYVIASVDTHIALTQNEPFTNVQVGIHPAGEDNFILSNTDVNSTIPSNDVDVDLFFIVGNVFPYNDLKKVVPESHFISMGTKNMPQINFDDLPSAVESGGGEESGSGKEELGGGGGGGKEEPGGGGTGGK